MTSLKKTTLALTLLLISSNASALDFLTWSVGDWIGKVDTFVDSYDEPRHYGGSGWWKKGQPKVTHEFIDKFLVRTTEQQICSDQGCTAVVNRVIIRERYEQR